ncbi:MAG: NAD(+) synthase, partial [Desulfobaccales bacterium]|nr:NAD(+) synthase [Desulfobaccales bacterium]
MAAVLVAEIVSWIQAQVKAAGRQGAVSGISGGIDSAVVAALGRRALGENYLGLILPCHSLAQDVKDARRLAQFLKVNYQEINLDQVFDLFISILPPGSPLAAANLKPRLRMVAWYYLAAVHDYLVLGTGNKSEIAVGYFTKYGDGAVDLLPLGDLLKTEVYDLARELDLPQWLLTKAPSAGLWAGQTDEGEMGVTYHDLDRFLAAAGRPQPQLNPAVRKRILELKRTSAHKRRPIPVFRKPAEKLG